MNDTTSKPVIGFKEFVLLMAGLMSLVALSIDAVLPAIGIISQDLAFTHTNQGQLLIGMIFLGLSLGNLLWGPLADSYGRKPIVCLGLKIFVLGCVLSWYADSLSVMLLGRFLQGFGVAGPRVLVTTMIRDAYQGDRMARVSSLAFSIFILMPIVAPFIGQGILMVSTWQSIFIVFVLAAAIMLVWFYVRMPESLKPDLRQDFSVDNLKRNLIWILKQKQVMRYTLANGLVNGAFIAFLSCTQQVFQDIYLLGEAFPLYFAMLAINIGLSAFINAHLVMRFGIDRICLFAFKMIVIITVLFLGFLWFYQGVPPLAWTMIYLSALLFNIGLLFGNLNAKCLEPLGERAGIGASVVASLCLLIGLPVAFAVSWFFTDNLYPVVCAILICHLVSFWLMKKE